MTQLRPPPGGFPLQAPSPGANAGANALGPALVRWTRRGEGDMADPTGTDPIVRSRREAVVARPWTWLVQVHGAQVVVVDAPGGAAGRVADAAATTAPGAALAIFTADCAPLTFASPEGVIGAAHAGWRGLVAGVIEETASTMRRLGASSIVAALGPCIHAGCYAFGPEDLDTAANRLGSSVRGETRDGRPALDIPQAVRVALERAGAELVVEAGICTACSAEHWSWRARHDRQRQATVVWLS